MCTVGSISLKNSNIVTNNFIWTVLEYLVYNTPFMKDNFIIDQEITHSCECLEFQKPLLKFSDFHNIQALAKSMAKLSFTVHNNHGLGWV